MRKHVMSCKLEPAIWSCDIGQPIPCFDRCQLVIAWMSNIKEVHGKPRLYVFSGVWPKCWATPPSSPTSNIASHENHEKTNSWVSFSFAWWVWCSAWRPLGQPELRHDEYSVYKVWTLIYCHFYFRGVTLNIRRWCLNRLLGVGTKLQLQTTNILRTGHLEVII